MPNIDEDGNISSNKPITEATVRANIGALLAPLRDSSQNCGIYSAVVTGLEGYYGTPFAGIAVEYLSHADSIHRAGMGDLWEHLPGCPLR